MIYYYSLEKIMDDISVINLILEAGVVVKLVMIILMLASLVSWIVIIERWNFFRNLKSINHPRFKIKKFTIIRKSLKLELI